MEKVKEKKEVIKAEMNRMDLEKYIIAEGKKRKIYFASIDIADRGDYLDYYARIKNDYDKGWIYKHQVEELIHDCNPICRKFQIQEIGCDSRSFKKGELIQLDEIWIRLDANENSDSVKKIMDYSSGCGQWRQGWMTAKLVDDDDYTRVMFERDVWYEKERIGISSIYDIDENIKNGKIIKLEKGQPMYCGRSSWTVRKIKK